MIFEPLDVETGSQWTEIRLDLVNYLEFEGDDAL